MTDQKAPPAKLGPSAQANRPAPHPGNQPGAPNKLAPNQAKGGAVAASKAPPKPAPPKAPPAMNVVGAGAAGKPPIAWMPDVLELNTTHYLRQQRNRFFLRFFLFVILPTILSAVYVFLYATPRYVSEFQIAYKTMSPTASVSSTGTLGSLLGSMGTTDMTSVLNTYLISSSILDTIDKKLNLRGQYSASSVDWLDRMPEDASKEKFLTYFQRRVSVYQQSGGFLTVDVEAFSRQDAKATADAMVEAADAVVSDMGNRPRQDALKYAEAEMRRFEDGLTQATRDITVFRNTYYDYDFQGTVTQLGSVVGGLQAQLAQARSDLAQARTFLGENAPSVIVLNSRIKALDSQVKAEQARLASPNPMPTEPSAKMQASASPDHGKDPYSKIMAAYAELLQRQELARANYTSAKQGYELARADFERKQDYAVSFVPPNVPDEALNPSGYRYIFSTFVIALLAYAIGSILIGMMRDQAGL